MGCAESQAKRTGEVLYYLMPSGYLTRRLPLAAETEAAQVPQQ
jgi:hypothetical protein